MAADSHAAVEAVRAWQSNAPVVGAFFDDCYKFLDWLADDTFVQFIPPVSLRVGKLKRRRLAEYTPADGAMLPTITIDVTKSKNPLDLLEWLAHELIHHWQWCIGHVTAIDVEDNVHDDEFQHVAMEWGLSIEPKTGRHRGYVGEVWESLVQLFLKDTGVDFARHELPGPQEPERRLHKWQCGVCDFSFRSRRTNVAVMCEGGDEVETWHSPTQMRMVE